MKCQNLFSLKNLEKKKSLPFAENFTQSAQLYSINDNSSRQYSLELSN